MYFKFSDKVTRTSKVDKAHLWLYIQNHPPTQSQHHRHHHSHLQGLSSVGKMPSYGANNATVWIHIYKVGLLHLFDPPPTRFKSIHSIDFELWRWYAFRKGNRPFWTWWGRLVSPCHLWMRNTANRLADGSLSMWTKSWPIGFGGPKRTTASSFMPSTPIPHPSHPVSLTSSTIRWRPKDLWLVIVFL